MLGAIVSSNFNLALSILIYEHYICVSNFENNDNRVGDIVAKIERSAKSMGDVFCSLVLIILPVSLEIIGASIVIGIHIGMIYSSIFITAFIICLIVAFYAAKTVKKVTTLMNKEENATTSFLIERLSMKKSIHIYDVFRQEKQDARNAYRQWLKKTVNANVKISGLLSLKIVIIGISLCCVLLLSSYHILSGDLSTGDFIMINAYIIQLTMPLAYLIATIIKLQENLVNLKEASELIRAALKEDNSPFKVLSSCNVGIEIFQFNKAYDNHLFSTPLTFYIKKGECVVIKGDSGSGKTTLFNALNQLIQYEGTINIDGIDIKKLSRSSLANIMTAVTQTSDIIQGTLLSNIQYGNKHQVTEEQALQYCQLTCLSDFLKKNKEGLSYRVQTNGNNLSGGQKIRLSIARVLARKSDIIVLDEPSSALDENTEKQLINNIRLLGKTLIIISHSSSVAACADKVIDLNCYV